MLFLDRLPQKRRVLLVADEGDRILTECRELLERLRRSWQPTKPAIASHSTNQRGQK